MVASDVRVHPMEDAYPLETAATLKNGLTVTIRHLRPDDHDAIARAAAALDPETIYTRLFSYRPVTPAAIDRIMHVDPAHEVALVVVIGTPPAHQVIGSCRLVELDPHEGLRQAEVAFTVAEEHRGQGIAGRLLGHLIDIARARGIDALEADVLSINRSMLHVFEHCGLPMHTHHEGTSVHLTLSLK
jgi:RimJ/RimL family protein N-acetyltransferase